jgi:tRNA (guanine37-N1)-methyltransferase
MKFHILTLYPEMFPSILKYSNTGAALRDGLWQITITNIRDFAKDKHKTVDDTPYGGGAGMVLKADVLSDAIDYAKSILPEAELIFLSPRGQPLSQQLVIDLTERNPQQYILLCGRFEGIDERIIKYYQPLELSIGDYIMCGGELPALVLMEAMLRYLPNMLGNKDTLNEESFSIGEKKARLLEYSHYTKPPYWNGLSVPELLMSGDHAKIAQWRHNDALRLTQEKRADLWNAFVNMEKQPNKKN